MKKKILIVLIIVCIAMLSAFAMIACDTDENTVEMDGFKFKLLRDGTYKVAKYKGDATEVIIPSTCDGIKVTGIGDSAFSECWKITSITLPDEITSIGFGAFSNCRKLTSINIPEGITSIETNTFNCCYALTSINIPDGVTSIGESAFESCSELTKINIPDGVTDIGTKAFYECHSLYDITIPNSVSTIGESAFKGCYNLKNVTIGNKVILSIKDNAINSERDFRKTQQKIPNKIENSLQMIA